MLWHYGFPDSSVGKESSCSAGDTGLISGSGKSTREGLGYPLQYSWASLVAQLVKNPPTMQETWVWSLGWEDPLEKGMATHSSIIDSLGNSIACIVLGVIQSWMWLLTLLLLSHCSRVQLCATPEMAAHQAPLSLGFSRQEHWSGLPFPSPMQESEKWKWSRSVMSDS